MGIADRHLADDEQVVHVTRQHWSVLFGEFLLLLLIAAVSAAVLWALPTGEEWGRLASYGVLGGASLLAILLWLVPVLRWRTTVYVLTDRRLLKQYGILSTHGRSIPLSRVNDVSYGKSLLGRILRYGTLHVQSASEQGTMTWKTVPGVERLQTLVYNQIDREQHRPPPGGPRV